VGAFGDTLQLVANGQRIGCRGFELGRWHHLAFVVSAEERLECYLDARLVGVLEPESARLRLSLPACKQSST